LILGNEAFSLETEIYNVHVLIAKQSRMLPSLLKFATNLVSMLEILRKTTQYSKF